MPTFEVANYILATSPSNLVPENATEQIADADSVPGSCPHGLEADHVRLVRQHGAANMLEIAQPRLAKESMRELEAATIRACCSKGEMKRRRRAAMRCFSKGFSTLNIPTELSNGDPDKSEADIEMRWETLVSDHKQGLGHFALTTKFPGKIVI